MIPEDVRRFVLTSIPSVPYLEALLLAHREPQTLWDVQLVARRLYISERRAREVMDDLAEAGFIANEGGTTPRYRYRPRSAAQGEIVDRLATAYSENLVEMTNLIHARAGQLFVDAFRFRKD